MSDYQLIAQALAYIREHLQEQPSLAEVAAQLQLSESHFQRVFSRWAGVSPKRYMQVLTLERAKQQLQERGCTVLSASLEVGLSGGSRLYDHFVQLEAVTPSEFKLAGQGLSIYTGCHLSPFGEMFIATTKRGICQLDFIDTTNPEKNLQTLRAQWPNADIQENNSLTQPFIKHLFEPRSNTPLSLWVKGTNFQLNVWRALLTIPSAQVRSYQSIAEKIGKPKAARAVGTAIGANPIALMIPCHRVLRQSGELGGYRWGEVRKHAILVREFSGEN